MRKFFAVFAILFGITSGAWGYRDEQDNNVDSSCGAVYDGDGYKEFIVYFNTDVTEPCGNIYGAWKDWLEERVDDIGAVLILGSADAHRTDGIPKKNIDLSQERAQWVVDNLLPGSIRGHCPEWDGGQMYTCQVYAMGDANDFAHSDGKTRDENADARAAHLYVIWRQAKCPQGLVSELTKYQKDLAAALQDSPRDTEFTDAKQRVDEALGLCAKGALLPSQVEDIYKLYRAPKISKCREETIDNIKKNKNALNAALEEHKDYQNDINTALEIINSLEIMCPETGKKLSVQESEDYAQKLSELNALIADKLMFIQGVSKISTHLTQYIQTTVSVTDVDLAYSHLKMLLDDLSVWRNAEGNFNMARVASDSIAAVVLGTAGGLVTSHLVKKAQLKQGFEDLQCVIGGHPVARYGDEFRVGLE